MISPDHARLMARYNRWQNESLYTEASTLADEARRQDRGAFFGSIHGTLSHLLWGDMIWMHRFTGSDAPAGGIGTSPVAFPDWVELSGRRQQLDGEIIRWADAVSVDWLSGSTSWLSSAAKRQLTRANWHLAAHFFNHQTHHRGQVHAMLTAAGAKPDDTDLMLVEVV